MTGLNTNDFFLNQNFLTILEKKLTTTTIRSKILGVQKNAEEVIQNTEMRILGEIAHNHFLTYKGVVCCVVIFVDSGTHPIVFFHYYYDLL